MSNADSELNIRSVKLKMEYGDSGQAIDISDAYNKLPPAVNGGMWVPRAIEVYEGPIDSKNNVVCMKLSNVNRFSMYKSMVLDSVNEILDASIVNDKQKKAIMGLIAKTMADKMDLL